MNKQTRLTLNKNVDLSVCFRYTEMAKMGVSTKHAITIAKNKNISINRLKTRTATASNDNTNSKLKTTTFDHIKLKNMNVMFTKTQNSPSNTWLKTLVKYQAKTAEQRTMSLKNKLSRISEFYKSLNTKYNLKGTNNDERLKTLIRLNKENTNPEDMDAAYSKEINAKINEMYVNIKGSRSKFTKLENYNKYAKKFLDFDKRMNYDRPEEKSAIKFLKKNREFIDDYNDSKYRFPIPKDQRFFIRRKSVAKKA